MVNFQSVPTKIKKKRKPKLLPKDCLPISFAPHPMFPVPLALGRFCPWAVLTHLHSLSHRPPCSLPLCLLLIHLSEQTSHSQRNLSWPSVCIYASQSLLLCFIFIPRIIAILFFYVVSIQLYMYLLSVPRKKLHSSSNLQFPKDDLEYHKFMINIFFGQINDH